ncbi:L-serine ammonia-lyase, iron-sulfur-dependent, subunit alpha [Vibrio alginolyticus]
MTAEQQVFTIFDIYKIGVGPSSSHTNGPMIAGYHFTRLIESNLAKVVRIQVDLYGSLSLTGIGHHTDRATILGLLGNKPDTIKIASANKAMRKAIEEGMMSVDGRHEIEFNYKTDMLFHEENLPLHENGMTITALDAHGNQVGFETYYSIGGGFIATADELQNGSATSPVEVEFPFSSADEMLAQAEKNGMSLGGMILKNEQAFQDMEAINQRAEQIWRVMTRCMERGFETEGILDGGLNVTRRAPNLLKKLEANAAIENDPMEIMDWINLFAFAVSEENAAGDFLAVSGAIGILYKTNASISGAEVGCQGEVGVSSSMAAAGLTALRGGSNEQICIAAEIAMEHSLGMTCDPIGGLVQVPCIERNAMGAMKAINASRMALKRNSKCLISLDKVIETMYQTGKDMNKKYRETSLGGLALIHLAPPCE